MRTDRRWRRLYGAGWLISAGVTLVAFRMWHLHLHEVEQRADEAERTRDEVARRRAVEERLRIARDLHDSLTHSISVIKVQAGVAVHLARKRGEEVPPALLAIQEASGDADASCARRSRSCAPTRARRNRPGPLAGLVERAQAAGLTVDRRRSPGPRAAAARGRPDRVPDRPGGAHQRLPPRRTGDARRTAQYAPDALTVQVDNDGAGRARPTRPPPGGWG